MNSPLSVTVSKFESYYNPEPSDVNLWEFLTDDSQDSLVQKLRLVENKKERDPLKAQLNCVTVSGRFENPRSLENIVERSGLMCIDVDPKDNPNIENYDEFKSIVSKASFVAYAGRSASGNGFYVIIPVEFPEKHTEHFLALQALFLKIGVVIDPACKDISRLRGRSYDPDPYINHAATKFRALKELPKPKARVTSFQYRHLDLDTTQAWVEKYIKALLERRVDVTGTYADWVAQGFAFASEFGENGRDYFHDISSIYPDYDAEKCDKQYNRCVKGRGNGIRIGTFFHACKVAGINLKGAPMTDNSSDMLCLKSYNIVNQPVIEIITDAVAKHDITLNTGVTNSDTPQCKDVANHDTHEGIIENPVLNRFVENEIAASSNKSVEREQGVKNFTPPAEKSEECDTIKKEVFSTNAKNLIDEELDIESNAFDLEEFRRWAKLLPNMAKTIRIPSSDHSICNVKLFLTGRLNHISAFTGRNDQGNRSLFIRQVKDLRRILTNQSI